VASFSFAVIERGSGGGFSTKNEEKGMSKKRKNREKSRNKEDLECAIFSKRRKGGEKGSKRRFGEGCRLMKKKSKKKKRKGDP